MLVHMLMRLCRCVSRLQKEGRYVIPKGVTPTVGKEKIWSMVVQEGECCGCAAQIRLADRAGRRAGDRQELHTSSCRDARCAGHGHERMSGSQANARTSQTSHMRAMCQIAQRSRRWKRRGRRVLVIVSSAAV
jgi:hypothetical protein